MRNVAAQMDIDTSTLSKVERGDRPISIEYLKPLCEILLVDPIDIQISFITDKINRDLGQLEFIEEGLKAAQQQVKENQNWNVNKILHQ